MPREKLLIETFRFEDDDDYERDLFASFQKKKDTPEIFVVLFLTRKCSTDIFVEGG